MDNKVKTKKMVELMFPKSLPFVLARNLYRQGWPIKQSEKVAHILDYIIVSSNPQDFDNEEQVMLLKIAGKLVDCMCYAFDLMDDIDPVTSCDINYRPISEEMYDKMGRYMVFVGLETNGEFKGWKQ